MKKYLWQIGIIFGLCLLGEFAAALLPFPFPGSVTGMIFLFILLIAKLIKPEYIRETSAFLRENMSFFFIPSSVGLMQFFPELSRIWVQFIIICLVSTVLTFGVTSMTVRGVMKLQSLARKELA